MKVFVTGATGVLGRPTVTALIAKGASVRAAARSTQNRKWLESVGASPVNVDLFNKESIAAAVAGCDAVLHLATSIPKAAKMGKSSAWRMNDRLRSEATANIVAATAHAPTVKTVIYPGISFFYTDGGQNWIDTTHAGIDAPAPLKSSLIAEKHVCTFAAAGAAHRGIVLRFGAFYGPTSRDSVDAYAMAKKGWALPLAPASAYRSHIWIDDAAAAVMAALDSAPSGVHDVAELEPATQTQIISAMAQAADKPKLRQIPRFLLRLALPAEMYRMLGRSQRISSERFQQTTGWTAQVPGPLEGWAKIAKALDRPQADDRQTDYAA